MIERPPVSPLRWMRWLRPPKRRITPSCAHALAAHALADAGFVQQVDRALLEHAGAQRRLDFLAAARLEHDRFDAAQVQQVREQQARGSRADDADLCAHRADIIRRDEGKRSGKRVQIEGVSASRCSCAGASATPPASSSIRPISSGSTPRPGTCSRRSGTTRSACAPSTWRCRWSRPAASSSTRPSRKTAPRCARASRAGAANRSCSRTTWCAWTARCSRRAPRRASGAATRTARARRSRASRSARN